MTRHSTLFGEIQCNRVLSDALPGTGVSGTESEAELAYAGLHQLYVRLPSGIEEARCPTVPCARYGAQTSR
jgi:hypothetical protein